MTEMVNYSYMVSDLCFNLCILKIRVLSKSISRLQVQEPLKMFYDPVEWSYRMRRCMQEIIPGLFLGPYSAAVRSNLPVLQAAGITHVICVRQDVEAGVIKQHFTDRFQYVSYMLDNEGSRCFC